MHFQIEKGLISGSSALAESEQQKFNKFISHLKSETHRKVQQGTFHHRPQR